MKYIILILITNFSLFYMNAQNVAINTEGTSPHSSAILDVNSDTLGILVPRMTSVNRNGINTPADGLLVYDTDTNGFWFYNSTIWTNLSSGASASDQIKDVNNDTKILVEESPNEDTIRYYIGGTEHFKMDASGHLQVLNTGKSIFIGENAGKNDDLSDKWPPISL